MTQIVDCIDNLEALPAMDESCIDAIVTDPPYGLAFMGKSWDKALPDRRTWSELLRVLKPGGHAVIFGAPRLYHRLAVDVEDAGFEIRDCLMWLFGSGFPKSLDVSKAIDKAAGAEREVVGRRDVTRDLARNGRRGDEAISPVPVRGATIDVTAPATEAARQWQGWGTALKPAYEPILLCRKPLDGTVAANVLAHGTGGINVDACRIGDEGGGVRCTNRDENGKCRGHKNAGQSTSGETFHGPEPEGPLGRWPANVLLDDDGLEDWRRYFYCAKASRSEREAGLISDGARANTHPTVKPVSLMRWLVRLVTPRGGLVLDPFCGSGSTGVACVHEGVRFLGLELDAGYAEIARARIAHAKGPLLR